MAQEYTASTTANVISTAGDAALSVLRSRPPDQRRFALPQPLRVEFSEVELDARRSPTTAVTITFKQAIGASDALRTGTYSKTLTFTLSTDRRL